MAYSNGSVRVDLHYNQFEKLSTSVEARSHLQRNGQVYESTLQSRFQTHIARRQAVRHD